MRRSAGALLRAVEDYMSLGRVLRGDFVPGILGATPPGYILTRTGQLAEGAAPLAAMVWDGGAPWGSRPWRPTHAPADSALLLYLLACYLEAPRWDFASRSDHRRPASYGPLFLGQMPHGSLPATRHFSALLEGSQAPKGGVAHAVVYDRALHPPQFQLVVGGKTTLVLRGRSGLFNTLVLWFWYARVSAIPEAVGCDDCLAGVRYTLHKLSYLPIPLSQKHFRGLIGDLSISATLHLDDVFDHSQEPSILGLRRILGL